MQLKSIFDGQKRARFLSRTRKKILNPFRNHRETIPFFVFGTQRSGTNMLMFTFEIHPDTDVHNESESSKAFYQYRIRDLATIRSIISDSKARFICFKPLADSHLIADFLSEFPEAKFLWPVRDYRDVANSSLNLWPHATHAIRKVMTDMPGGGWFQEGVSKTTRQLLSTLDVDTLSEFDLACLVWWTRNRIFFENELDQKNNVKVIKYETIVTDPAKAISDIFSFIGLPPFPKSSKYIHPRSIGKQNHPPIDSVVKKMCDDALNAFTRLLDQ